MARGLLIVFEGAEGAGKTTQAARLSQFLRERGVDTLAVREPGGTVLGEQIRALLLNPESDCVEGAEALLFLASRAQLVKKVVEPALERGAVVVLDRFFLSTFAYQVAGRGLDESAIAAANNLATGGLRPDLTLLLSIEPTTGMQRASKRGEHDRMELSGESFHRRVADAFGEYAGDAWQARHPECGRIVAIDGSGGEDEIFAEVMRSLVERWPARFSGTAARSEG